MNLTSPTPLPPWVLCSSETSTRGLRPGGGAEGPSHLSSAVGRAGGRAVRSIRHVYVCQSPMVNAPSVSTSIDFVPFSYLLAQWKAARQLLVGD